MSTHNKIARPSQALGALSAFLAAALFAPPSLAQSTILTEGHVKGRVIVAARAGVSDSQLAGALAAHSGKARRIGQTDLHIVELPNTASEAAVRNALARNPMVKFAELDMRFKLAAAVNDPYLGSAWHLARIEAPTAWDVATGQGVTLAILDTGVDGSHPDLAGQMVPGWNFYDNNANSGDVNGHGTAVAGAAAAAFNNGIGVASVAGAAKIMPIRVTDAGGYASSSTIAQGITWAADRGARVANVSISGLPGNATIQSAANYLRSKGGLLVTSAGNTGSDPGLPEDRTMTIVSATESNDALSSFSSYGRYVTVAAPGNYIWTTNRGGGYGQWWGTSFAAPVAAGVIALMMSARPELSASQVESLLYSSATDLGAAGRDNQFGHGRVNAAAAVAAARGAAASDTQAPTVAITSPAAGASVAGLVTVDVSASDNVGVSRVELRVNGQVLANDTSVPYQFGWDTAGLANGSYSLEAYAYDAAGNAKGSGAISVRVGNALPADTTAPVVRLVKPADGSTVSGTVTVEVSASDDSGTAGLRTTLFINGVQVAGTTGGTLSYRWNTRKAKSGSQTVSAVAVDAAGNRTTAFVVVRK